jgi:hypothetical protein
MVAGHAKTLDDRRRAMGKKPKAKRSMKVPLLVVSVWLIGAGILVLSLAAVALNVVLRMGE